MDKLSFREFIQKPVPLLSETSSFSTHAQDRVLDRGLLKDVQKLVTNVIEPWLYYYFGKKKAFDIENTGERGTEFVVSLELKDDHWCLVGTYKKDKKKNSPTPFILWITFFPINGPWFIKRGTDYKFTIRELRETEKDKEDSITIRTSKRKFSFTSEKDPSIYQRS